MTHKQITALLKANKLKSTQENVDVIGKTLEVLKDPTNEEKGKLLIKSLVNFPSVLKAIGKNEDDTETQVFFGYSVDSVLGLVDNDLEEGLLLDFQNYLVANNKPLGDLTVNDYLRKGLLVDYMVNVLGFVEITFDGEGEEGDILSLPEHVLNAYDLEAVHFLPISPIRKEI